MGKYLTNIQFAIFSINYATMTEVKVSDCKSRLDAETHLSEYNKSSVTAYIESTVRKDDESKYGKKRRQKLRGEYMRAKSNKLDWPVYVIKRMDSENDWFNVKTETWRIM